MSAGNPGQFWKTMSIKTAQVHPQFKEGSSKNVWKGKINFHHECFLLTLDLKKETNKSEILKKMYVAILM